MDVFGTIKNGIDLAIQVHDLIESIHGAPETLKRLGTEIQEVKVMLNDCKDILSLTSEPTETLLPLLQNVRGALQNVEVAILPYQMKAGKDGRLSAWTSLKITMKERDIEKYMSDFQRHKVLLGLINASINSRSQLSTLGKLEQLELMAKDKGTRLSEKETNVFFQFMQQQIEYSRMMQNVHMAFNQTINVLLLNETSLKSERNNMLKGSKEIEDDSQSIWSCQKFLDSLSISNVNDDRDNVANAEINTCRWIHKHQSYSKWIQSSESCTLHLAGKMGSGKSVLTKQVLKEITEDITGTPTPDESKAILFYFCSRVNRPTENASIMLEALIYQFLEKRRGLFAALAKQTELLGTQNLSGNSTVRSVKSLWKILGLLFRVSSPATIYCFVDALDECDVTSAKDFLSQYKDRQNSDGFSAKVVKFFISSRNSHEILTGLHRNTKVPIHHLPVTTDAVTPDIELVLNKDLELIAEDLCLDEAEKTELQNAITAKADGMFQWVNTALKVIGNADGSTFESLVELVESLPTELQDLYNKCLLSLLESLEDNDLELIRKLLAWILLGTRPMSISELMVALAIRPTDTTVPPRNRLHKSIGRFILRCLAPFVDIIPSQAESKRTTNPLDVLKDLDAIVRPVHNSAQEFLLGICTEEADQSTHSILKINKIQAHEDIARVCLVYLRSKELQLGWLGMRTPNKIGRVPVDDRLRDLIKARLKENSFLGYSTQNWAYHVRHCESRGNGDVFDFALDFVRSCPDGVSCSFQARQYLNQDDRDEYYPPCPPIQSAIITDSPVLVERFLAVERVDLNEVDSTGMTSLATACAGASFVDMPNAPSIIVGILLQHDADVHAVDLYGKTALHWSATYGHVGAIKLLIDKHASTEVHDHAGNTPIFYAIEEGETEAVKMLLSAHADYNAVGSEGCTPLHFAGRSGHMEIFQLLTQHGASMAAVNIDLWTPLHFAAAAGREDIVEFLVGRSANIPIDAKTNLGTTSLHFAASNGFWRTAKILCASGANVNAQNAHGSTALMRAVAEGHEETVRVLLSLGADPMLPSKDKQFPLHEAVDGGHISIVQSLLDSKASVNSRDYNGRSPLHIAAREEGVEAAKLLLSQADTNVEAMSDHGSTALHIAATRSSTELVALLLGAGAKIDSQTSLMGTPLFWAVEAGQIEIAKTLLEAGADVEVLDKEGQTVLHLAAQHGELGCCQLLIQSGATLIVSDKNKQTPFFLALRRGLLDVVDYFFRVGAKAYKYNQHQELRDEEGLRSEIASLPLPLPENRLDVVKFLLGPDMNASSLVDINNKRLLKFRLSQVTVPLLEYLLVEKAIDIHRTDDDGWDLLLMALNSGSVEAVELVLAQQPDVTIKSNMGWTCLHFAARFMKTRKVLDDLLSQTPCPHIDERDYKSVTPLHVAVAFGSRDVVEYLIEKGANTALKTGNGQTVLHLAVKNHNTEPLDSLLALKPALPINEGDCDGKTCLQIAASNCIQKVVEKVLRAGGDINSTDTRGWQAIHHSAAGNNLEVLRFLLGEDADVNKSDIRGQTPLHLAAMHDNEELLLTLLRNGAKYMSDHNGWTPGDIAAQYNLSSLWVKINALPVHDSEFGETKFKFPTRWSADDKPQELILSENGLVVNLIEGLPTPVEQRQDTEDGTSVTLLSRAYSLRSDFCVPNLGGYYFEVKILEDMGKGTIAVGFSSSGLSHADLPGWDGQASWAYHGDDGTFRCAGQGIKRCEKFTGGDVIGCGIEPSTRFIYATKNGKYIDLGPPVENLLGQLYPTVGLFHPGSKIKAAFGIAPPPLRAEETSPETSELENQS